MQESPIVRFERVGKAYEGQPALRDFSLDVAGGEFLTIVGSSGSGKTTALKMVNGLLTPDSGRVLVRGEGVAGLDLVRLRRRIGYVIQGSGLFPHLTVAENINYVPSLIRFGERRNRGRVARLLELVGLDVALADRYPGEMSGGQQQRVGIARALAAEPDIVLMDEPFGAVDEINRKALQGEMARLHPELGLTILFVTHDIREALALGDRVLVMRSGELVQAGTPAEIVKNPADAFVEELLAPALAPELSELTAHR